MTTSMTGSMNSRHLVRSSYLGLIEWWIPSTAELEDSFLLLVQPSKQHTWFSTRADAGFTEWQLNICYIVQNGSFFFKNDIILQPNQ